MSAYRRNQMARAASARTMLTSVAALAASLATGGGPAFAQAFLGSPTVASGNVDIDRSTPDLDVVTIGSNQAVINWSPSDTAVGGGLNNPINFLPANGQVVYQNNSAVTDYTVLNRIVPVDPSRPVVFNGTVTSQLTDILGNAGTGGSVWFYSPGGIIVGDGAVFDIGSLLLTTLDPLVDGGGNFLTGGAFSLQQATPSSIVNILSNAAINATAEGSYVALVAPLVYQRGTVTVNGSAAYVAAEAADITINNGLFDINVTVGSTDNGFPLQHLGTTTGPASTGVGDNHRIYMVTIPKNDAVTMVFGDTSQLGFDIAGAADVVNNVVVLSAGRNVSDTSFAATPVNGIAANIAMDGGAFTSYLTARATTNLFAASNTGTTQFASAVRFQAGGSAQIAARQAGVTMNIGGNVTIVGDAVSGIANGADATAGEALLYADNGGILNVAGNATIQANAVGGAIISGPGTTGSGIAGRTLINADSGTVIIAGDVTMTADGTAGAASGAGVEAGDGTGGLTEMTVDNGGSISVLGSVTMSARGYGGENSGGGDGISGTGTGGVLNLLAVNGTIDIDGDVSADVLGSGGFTLSGIGGGLGQGGQAQVSAGAGALTIGADLSVLAQGSGGSVSFSGIGGAAQGGAALVDIYQPGGSIAIGGAINVSATANGGMGGSGGSGSGGAATGGTARISAFGGALTLGDEILVEANGFGGSGASGGDGTAGRATIAAERGSVSADPVTSNVNVQAYSFGGDAFGSGGTGGNGIGGIAEIVALNGTSASSITLGEIDADASGRGGQGGFGLSNGGPGGRGGDGTGGQVLLLGSAGNGTLSLGVVDAEANGAGGDGGRGGDDFMMIGAGGVGGRGGDGRGGNIQLGMQSGTATPANTGSASFIDVVATTDGEGGRGGDGGSGLTQGAYGRGGDGIGGVGGGTVLLVRGSPVTAGSITLTSNGIGGDGGLDLVLGAGGDGEGGNVAILVTERFQSGQPGSLSVAQVTGEALAMAGAGLTPGAARYGSADIQVQNSTVSAGSITMRVEGDTPGVAAALPSSISVVNGTIGVSDALSMETPGNIALVTDGGTIEAAGFIAVSGGSIVNSIDGTLPAAAGVVRANFIDLQVAADMISGASLESLSSLSLAAPGIISLGDVASDGVVVAVAGGGLTLGDVVSGDEVELSTTAGNATVGAITALSDVDVVAGGSVVTGAIVSGDSVTVGSGTTVNVASISAGLINPSTDPLARYRVGVDAGTSMTIGNIAAASDIGLLARTGTVTAGVVTTPGSLLALAANGATLGGATTGTGAGNTVYLADASMAMLLDPDFDPAPLLAATPIATAGAISIGGPVSTGRFVAAGQSFTAQAALTAGTDIRVAAAQTATFNGIAGAPVVTVNSGDIAIGASGGLGTATTSQLTLATSNASAVIGGSQPATGYVLDGTEAQRLRAANILIDTIGAGAGGQIILRDLDMVGASGPNANVTSTTGSFGVTGAGNIQVSGNVRLTGMTTDNALRLSAGKVAVTTDTGSIGLFGSGTALSGLLDVQAADVHVAGGTLLSQLDSNPAFAGRDQALAQVSGIARPEGYIQAGALQFSVGRSLLIQNSNNSAAFGGFTAGTGGMRVLAMASNTPVDMIVYGRLADSGGTFVINGAVRDALTLIPEGAGFSAVSSVNGCLLSAPVCTDEAPSPPVADMIVGSIATDVLAIVQNAADPTLALTDEEAGQAAARSPIMPPVSLISVGAMKSDDLIEEPVTSGGNPSLMSPPVPGANTIGGRE